MSDHDRLRAIADAAALNPVCPCGAEPGTNIDCEWCVYVDTFDPPTVRKLLGEIAEARAIAVRLAEHRRRSFVDEKDYDQYEADAVTVAKWGKP